MPSVADFEPGKGEGRERGMFVHSVYHPGFAERPPRPERLSQDVVRVFDPVLLCWVVAPGVVGLEPEPAQVLPVKRWELLRKRDGQSVYRFRAHDLDGALAVKRRVCGERGWPLGSVLLEEV